MILPWRLQVIAGILLLWSCPLIASKASAHSQSYGYLSVVQDGPRLAGKIELAVRDLDLVHRLDRDGDGKITWGEFKSRESEIASATMQRISVGVGSTPCKLIGSPALVDSHGGESYIVFPFSSACDARNGRLDLDYDLLFENDAQHRGLVSVTTADGNSNFVVTPEAHHISIEPQQSNWLHQAASYVTHGIHHILSGYDHILFLLTLLFGTAVQQRGQPVRKAFLETAKVVTAFTLSHSVTLGLAALGILNVPSAIAESLIAATIALAAVNNLWPFLTRKLWLVALVFGLIHGVGFASVLTSLGLPRDNLLVSLLAFNVGVEIGQLAIVAVSLPLILIAARPGIGRLAFPAANCAITAVALMWLSDRMLGTALMPF